MAVRIAISAAGHRVDRRAGGETTAVGPVVDGDLHGRRRLAATILLGITGFLFATPPAVALLVMAGLIR